MNHFINFKPSNNADSIYYADLFRIKNKVWAITGHGKSDAGRIASNYIQADDLARDSVALTRVGNDLFGHCDFGAFGVNALTPTPHPISVIAYCMGEAETAKAYSGKPIEIVEADNDLIAFLFSDRPYPGSMAAHVFSHDEYEQLIDPRRRLDRFIELTQSPINTRFLIVPFMPTVQQKAALYTQFTVDYV